MLRLAQLGAVVNRKTSRARGGRKHTAHLAVRKGLQRPADGGGAAEDAVWAAGGADAETGVGEGGVGEGGHTAEDVAEVEGTVAALGGFSPLFSVMGWGVGV